ncbi:conserved hypothetical protein [Pediculus humanus corporis]|uniref:Protein zer-1 homolog-like C-terminal domain-containing protein n=1 Tax=Pediculus humanus subsp. corporis TaxID=121224 RepID=E0VFF0_PEDHC|nr:uncharacterized protein Phum_PHUM156350 [Pediculus humanus corporis]EEB12106.1 conserved hypothetical protein [Pediculus humanus corporis]
MFESPESLQDICINCIANNIENLCRSVQYCDGITGLTSKLVFKNEDVYLHSELSEQLLTALCDKGKLTDLNITLFDSKYTRLKYVILQNANFLTRKGLRILKGHSISSLKATGLKVTVNDLILCLGDRTLQNLKCLNVSGCSFLELDSTIYCVVVALSKLHCLQYLNVSCTEFNTHGLGIVCEDLPQLEALDISNTSVDDISSLRKCKNRLKSLAIEAGTRDPFEIFSPVRARVSQLLRATNHLPKLISLDVSGKDDVNIKDVSVFLQDRPNVVFLGLLYSDACYSDRFINTRHSEYNPKLTVTGTASETQILESLRRYSARPLYIHKALCDLFRLMPTYVNEPRVDIIKLVLKGMALHPMQFGVQMAATACLYNLTKGELAAKIHPTILKDVVELALTAMENFPKHYQMQKNTLLTLCSDRILQDVQFDKFRCVRLVLVCLCNFDDSSINRMSVAICSILAAKICTNETDILGAQPVFMRKLLKIVRNKVETQSVDITIKFTLSALWNLTDESPLTCKVFLEEGGMSLFLSVLEVFAGECAIETKVLGLINNIAEVAELRPQLMIPKFIHILRKLLVTSGHIDVSYFAAGIIAHLASDGPEAWTIPDIGRDYILKELATAVELWEMPEGEMVSYRSFHHFFPLLARNDAYQLQLWAAWAIRHVCAKNAKKYCPMLIEQGGYKIIHDLSTNPNVHENVRAICVSILKDIQR